MKKIVTLLAMVACMTTVTAANPVIKNLGDSKYCIEIGNLSMTIHSLRVSEVPSGQVHRKNGTGLLCKNLTNNPTRWRRKATHS